jgi:hypothetical protein
VVDVLVLPNGELADGLAAQLALDQQRSGLLVDDKDVLL